MMKKLLTPFFLVALCSAFLAGCSSTNTTTVGLKVELTNVNRTADGRTQVAWRIVNPNVVSYLVAEASHKVYLNGVLVGTVRNRDAVAVPANATTEGVATLTMAGSGAEQALAAALAAGSAGYRTEVVLTIRLYGDTVDKGTLSTTGTVPVTAK
jgi:LEA14-like dessication related protein